MQYRNLVLLLRLWPHPQSPTHSGKEEATTSMSVVGQRWLRGNWSVAGGLSITFQSTKATRTG